MEIQVHKEKNLNNSIDLITLEENEIINWQMKNIICKIKLLTNEKGTGFLYKIPFPDKNNLLTVLITANHLINEEYINSSKPIYISFNNNKVVKIIYLEDRIIYTNKDYDATIIEIKKTDEINQFFEFDENITNKDLENNFSYNGESVYLLHYPENKSVSVSFGKIIGILYNSFIFNHTLSTRNGSSGSPIINLLNKKVIGIHIEATNNNYNRGVFLNYIINDFIIKNYKNTCVIKELERIKKENSKILDLKVKNLKNEDLYILCRNNLKNSKNLPRSEELKKIEIIHLNNNKISDINIFSQIDFKEVKELYLESNKISNINIFKIINVKNIEKLNLSDNSISNIDVLENQDFKNLKQLSLHKNKLSDISILGKAKFTKLDVLSLSFNNISDISALEVFKELKQLYLTNNLISDINLFKTRNFEKLEILALGGNNISDISSFENSYFKNLKILCLYDNKIKDINIFEKSLFTELDELSLEDNQISNIDVLSKVKFKNLKFLGLSNNSITNIDVFKNIIFPQLRKLSLDYNYIDIEKSSSIIGNLKLQLNKEKGKIFKFSSQKQN